MHCSACGRDNRQQAEYCAWCGERLPHSEPAPLSSASSTGQAFGAEHSEAQQDQLQFGAVTRKLDLDELPRDGGALEIGDLLNERFEILGLEQETPDSRAYRALDRSRCSACGHVSDRRSRGAYCEQCGAVANAPAKVTVIEYLYRRPETYDGHFQQAGRDYYIVHDQQPEPSDEPAQPLHLAFGSATHPGCQYAQNEDALDARLYTDHRGTRLGFFVVADGLGGQASGEQASQLAAETAWMAVYGDVWQEAIQGSPPEGEACRESVADAVSRANEAVYTQRIADSSDMSTTMTLALVIGEHACIANVGDSRTYIMDDRGLSRVTVDHSLVQRLVDAGQLEPDQVYTHPRRNVIYQSIGDRPRPQIDTFSVELSRDARLVLCSDGLWEMVRDEGVEEVLLAEPDPQRAADRLVRNALAAGGADNISVIVVQLQA